jgi:hypothetical protein
MTILLLVGPILGNTAGSLALAILYHTEINAPELCWGSAINPRPTLAVLAVLLTEIYISISPAAIPAGIGTDGNDPVVTAPAATNEIAML